jgi:hypothetical protein
MYTKMAKNNKWPRRIPKWRLNNKWPQHIPKLQKTTNGHNIYQTSIKESKWPQSIPNGHKRYQKFPIKSLQKCSKTGLKINHLATLVSTRKDFLLSRNCIFRQGFPFFSPLKER